MQGRIAIHLERISEGRASPGLLSCEESRYPVVPRLSKLQARNCKRIEIAGRAGLRAEKCILHQINYKNSCVIKILVLYLRSAQLKI